MIRFYALFIACVTALAFFFHQGRSWNGDSRLLTVYAVVEHKTLIADDWKADTGDYAVVNGHIYSDKAPLTSLVVLPFYWAWRVHEHFRPQNDHDHDVGGHIGIVTACAAPFAIFAALVFARVRRRAASGSSAVWIALLAACSSCLLTYGGVFFGHMLAAALFIAAYALAVDREKHFLLAGFLGSLSVLTEYTLVLTQVLMCAYLLFGPDRRRRLGEYLIGASPGAALMLVYNHAITGRLTDFPYSHVPDSWAPMQKAFGIRFPDPMAAWELMFGQYRGLLFYAPCVLLFLPLILIRFDAGARRRTLVLVISTVYILFVSSYFKWDGGWCTGPRHLAPVIALLTYEGAGAFAAIRRGRLLFTVLALWGTLVAVCASATDAIPSEDIKAPAFDVFLPKMWKGDLNDHVFLVEYGFHKGRYLVELWFLVLTAVALLLTWVYKRAQARSSGGPLPRSIFAPLPASELALSGGPGNPVNVAALRTNRLPLLLLAMVFVGGAALRLAYPGDIEFKGDERSTFDTVIGVAHGAPRPDLGIDKGVGVRSAGFGVDALALLAWAARVSTPVGLARIIEVSSLVALVLLGVFIARKVLPADREAWLWGLALACVNPFDVLLERKISAPGLFPLLGLALLAAWWSRERRAGAFVWGLTGMLIGQLETGGFLVALAYLLGTLAADRGRGVHWPAWFAGAALGLVPMFAWAGYASGELTNGSVPGLRSFYATFSAANHPLSAWVDRLSGQFFWVWTTGLAGFGLDSTYHRQIWRFLESPLIAGHATYGSAVATATATCAVVVIVLRFVAFALRDRAAWLRDALEKLAGLRPADRSWLAVANGFFWFGAVATISRFFVHRYYLLAAFPLQGVWLARTALGSVPTGAPPQRAVVGRALLAVLLVACFAVTARALVDVHGHRGIPDGDFGVSYGAQHR